MSHLFVGGHFLHLNHGETKGLANSTRRKDHESNPHRHYRCSSFPSDDRFCPCDHRFAGCHRHVR
ncbi:hypothetical protein CBM2595_A80060 [Cupriavidus taiwanensis]|nr:hypothetical protein CBM2595_A80060 [Cupriavidus taiwanensis]